MACVAGRTYVWLFWFSSTLITGAYSALSLYSFSSVYRAYKDVKDMENSDQTDEELRALLAATSFSCAMVIIFAIGSLIVLLGKTLMHTAGGVFYGMLLSAAFHMFATILLCALVLHGFKDELSNFENESEIDWESIDTRAFKATYVMGYISAFVYLMFGLTLVFCSAVFKEFPARAEHRTERVLNEPEETKEEA